MDNIASLFVLQKATYTLPIAYDYFCSELEKTLVAIFENKEEPMKDMGDIPFEKKMLHSVIVAVSHIIYLNDCFKTLTGQCFPFYKISEMSICQLRY